MIGAQNKENDALPPVIWLSLSLFSLKHQTFKKDVENVEDIQSRGDETVKGTDNMTAETSLRNCGYCVCRRGGPRGI